MSKFGAICTLRFNNNNIRLLVIMWFLQVEVCSSSGCLGWAAFFIVALPEPFPSCDFTSATYKKTSS